MGNLYTHLQRRNSKELGILSQLRQAYRCTPRDDLYINQLQEKLKDAQVKHRRDYTPKRKVLKGIFGKPSVSKTP
jgi:hypothetical protein